MAMSTGGTRGQRAEINVTPMIDVLLVLIIIFMVITPVTPRGLNALVPQPAAQPAEAVPAHDIVITIAGGGSLLLNAEPLTLDGLRMRLERLFQNRPAQAVFVRADKELEFQQVAEVIDVAKGAGVDRIGLMTR